GRVGIQHTALVPRIGVRVGRVANPSHSGPGWKAGPPEPDCETGTRFAGPAVLHSGEGEGVLAGLRLYPFRRGPAGEHHLRTRGRGRWRSGRRWGSPAAPSRWGRGARQWGNSAAWNGTLAVSGGESRRGAVQIRKPASAKT